MLWIGRDALGQVRALVPTVLCTRPSRGPWRTRLLYPVGPDANLTELQPILCRAEDAAAAHVGFSRALRARAGGWDGFRWSSVPSELVPLVSAAGRVEHLRSVPNYLLRTGHDWEAFRSGLPRNVKEAVRRSRNAPARAGLDLRFRAIYGERELLRHLPDFLRLHAARSEAADLVHHANAFAAPSAQAFLSDLLLGWSSDGTALLFALFDGPRLVACRAAFRRAETLYLYYSGFEPAYAPFSVMTRTLVEAMQWSVERGACVVNLSTGTDTSKTRWHPDCVPYETLRQWSPTLGGSWARLLFQLFGRERPRGGSAAQPTVGAPSRTPSPRPSCDAIVSEGCSPAPILRS